MVRAIVLNPNDNVATLIDNGAVAGAAIELRGEKHGKIAITQNIPFGHKVALAPIAEGADVIKYGKVIGECSAAIAIGAHVHVHNVESKRGRGDKLKIS